MLIVRFSQFLSAWRAARSRHRKLAELSALDDRTLRDLGLSRGELQSWVAEDEGSAPASRRRLRATATPSASASGGIRRPAATAAMRAVRH